MIWDLAIMAYTAKLDGLGQLWQTGADIIDLEVTLGAGKSSNSCKIVLSDPQHIIAKALVNHAASIGGIQPIERPDSATTGTPTATGATTTVAPQNSNSVAGGRGVVSRGAGWTPELLAALDTIAHKEVPNSLAANSYYANNFEGYFTDQDIKDGGGFPKTARRSQNVGRYQFNRGDWEYAKKVDPSIKGYSPEEQDRIAWLKLFKLAPLRGGKELLAGDYNRFVTLAGREWASIPGSPYGQVQDGYTRADFDKYYQERLAYHKTGKVETVASAKESPKTNTTTSTSVAATGADTTTPPVKGSALTVSVLGVDFQFVHQSTKFGDNGQTEIGGQGVRYLLSRRSRSKTEKGLSLKDLAAKIAKAHGVELDWQSSINPTYEHVDQTGISDYALLERECSNAGLFIAERDSKLVIKSRDKLAAPKLTIARGLNLISYSFTDTAVNSQSNDYSALLTQENKTTIDPLEGKVVNQKDVDRIKDGSVTGKPTPTVAATPAQPTDSSTPAVDTRANKARTKRIAGLPSKFTVPLSVDTVAIAPTDTVLTDGFGGVLDRIWLVDKVTHNASANTSTFDLVSPIDVIDSAPGTPASTGSTAATTPAPAGSWVYPCSGTTTSPYNLTRRHPVHGDIRPHRGWDIANVVNTPIYAAAAGKVYFVGDRGFGGGNQIDIDHGNGYKTLYLHNTKVTATVGQTVAQGEQIAFMGNTGAGTGVHLHFSVKYNGAYIDPATIFKKFSGKGVAITAKEVA